MPVNTSKMELFARCASGFESILAQELKELGMRQVRPLKGGVSFCGGHEDAYRVCLWSRVATRVQLVIARVPASTADQYYRGVATIGWEKHLTRGSTIALGAHGANESLRNTSFAALKAKDAICDHLREVWGERPQVDTRNPDLRIDIAIHEKKATIYLNLSGESLHRRGYREDGVQTEAPLKETLAAGLLLAAGWKEISRRGGALIDPMCGSGTIAIEGALIAMGIAPGMLRERWGFETWALHDEIIWANLVANAATAIESSTVPCIIAGDIDDHAISIARDNARRAGVASNIQFYVDDAAHLNRHIRGMRKRGHKEGLLVTNPPYGERLGTQRELLGVHKALAEAVNTLPEGWNCAIITPNVAIDSSLGRTPAHVVECYNGPLEVTARMYDGAQSQRSCEVVSLSGKRKLVPLGDERSAQFASRLRKMGRERAKWARRNEVSCYRVYDEDIPEYRLSVDVYQEAGPHNGRKHVLVREHRRPRSVSEETARRRLFDACTIASAVFDTDPDCVHVRMGRDSRMQGTQSELIDVEENGLMFEVDLAGRPDTGLPLEQRGLRSLVRNGASGKRFLNLFGSSSAASACAAAGGAQRSVTLEPYADRASRCRKVLKKNGMGAKAHIVEEKEASDWLGQVLRKGEKFDMALCVPPVWMPNLDVQALVPRILEVLNGGGVVILAGSDRLVVPWLKAFESQGRTTEDVSTRVLELDFKRSRNPYSCYVVR